jgi:cytochrome c-type biogenesis protein CcmH/NrfG
MTIFLLLLWNFYIPLGGKKPGPSMSTSLLPQISAGDKTENLSDLWQEVTLQYPGYRDGFVQLAKWQYFSGKRQDAHDSLQKARNLDPNNQDIQLLLQNLAD